jgi:chemotaxis signal transduction protein
VGIPAEQTEKIISVSRTQTAVRETENGETFISLPALFRLNDSAPHGVVLKNQTPKTVLLTPKIDIDLEIPEENMGSLPESFSGWSRYFRGACFNEHNMILILDPEKLKELAQ